MGLVDELQRTKGFMALRLNEPIGSDVLARGIGLGHQLLGNDEFVVAHLAFQFYGFKTYHALINPANTVAQRVLNTMALTADHFFFTIDDSGSATLFRSEFGEQDLAGLESNLPRMRLSSTTQVQYRKALLAFSKQHAADSLLDWICHDDPDLLDLGPDPVVLTPS